MIIIFTGNGKGKTTAALGQAIRAIGNGSRVLMVEFIKKEEWPSGEDVAVRMLGDNFTIIKTGKGFVGSPCDKLDRKVHEEAAQNGLKLALQKAKTKEYNILILDEILVALSLNLVSEKQVHRFVDEVVTLCDHVILTGRGASESVLKRADLVTEMKEVKHPFTAGILAAKGVEY